MSAVTDQMRAVAVLALDRQVLSPKIAVRLITEAKRDVSSDIVAQLRDIVGETALLAAIALELGVGFYDPDTANTLTEDAELTAQVDLSVMATYGAFPLRDRDGGVVVASSTLSLDLQDYLNQRFPQGFRLSLCAPGALRGLLARAEAIAFEARLVELEPPKEVLEAAKASSQLAAPKSIMVEWVDSMLERAVAERASDIHMNMGADGLVYIRFRIDGTCIAQPLPGALRYPSRAREVVGALLNKCSGFDPTNLLEPQDGMFSFTAQDREFDVRVAVLPQSNGPSVVMRLLDSSSVRTARLATMGFSVANSALLAKWIQASKGMILTCGPTGSGKTTTLYSLLMELDPVSRNIITVENPVEYKLPGINQTPIREDLGERSVTFPRALRTILRMDPDVILVGEIRDEETAKIATEAAITGHLVLSTLHTNDAHGVYPRLSQLKVEAPNVAEAVSLVISQRLIRRLHDCAAWVETPESDRALLGGAGFEDVEKIRVVTGCAACNGTGYRGRVAVVEVLEASQELQALVAAGAPMPELLASSFAAGFQTIEQDAVRHLAEGRTSVSEAARLFPMTRSAGGQ